MLHEACYLFSFSIFVILLNDHVVMRTTFGYSWDANLYMNLGLQILWYSGIFWSKPSRIGCLNKNSCGWKKTEKRRKDKEVLSSDTFVGNQAFILPGPCCRKWVVEIRRESELIFRIWRWLNCMTKTKKRFSCLCKDYDVWVRRAFTARRYVIKVTFKIKERVQLPLQHWKPRPYFLAAAKNHRHVSSLRSLVT